MTFYAILAAGTLGTVFGFAFARVLHQEQDAPAFNRCNEPALGGPCTLRAGHPPVSDDSYQSGGHRYYSP